MGSSARVLRQRRLCVLQVRTAVGKVQAELEAERDVLQVGQGGQY